MLSAMKWFRSVHCGDNVMPECISCFVSHKLKAPRYGLLKPNYDETIADYQGTIQVVCPGLEVDEDIISRTCEDVREKLQKIEQRKKYAEVHFDECVYVIGGYIYDNGTRTNPRCEYKYVKRLGKMEAIPKMSPARINFGLVTDGTSIVVIGGQTLENIALRSCLIMRIESEEWREMPFLPAPTVAPGVCISDQSIHVVGGYDIIEGSVEILSDHLTFDIANRRWIYLPPIYPGRARPILIYPEEVRFGNGIYCVGGVSLNDKTGKAQLIEQIAMFDFDENRWKHITKTPTLNTSNFVSYQDGYIQICEKNVDSEGNVVSYLPLKSFNLEENVWCEGGSPTKRKNSEIVKLRETIRKSGRLPMNLISTIDIETKTNDKLHENIVNVVDESNRKSIRKSTKESGDERKKEPQIKADVVVAKKKKTSSKKKRKAKRSTIKKSRKKLRKKKQLSKKKPKKKELSKEKPKKKALSKEKPKKKGSSKEKPKKKELSKKKLQKKKVSKRKSTKVIEKKNKSATKKRKLGKSPKKRSKEKSASSSKKKPAGNGKKKEDLNRKMRILHYSEKMNL